MLQHKLDFCIKFYLGTNVSEKHIATIFRLDLRISVSLPAILKMDIISVYSYEEDRGSTVVKVLRYKPEGRWFDS